MSALARLDLGKLAKVAAMFSSPYDGERAGAALLADRMVRSAGLTWPELLQPVGRVETERRREFHLSPGEILARHGDRLTGWERGFLASLIRRPRPWSPRQNAVLAEIRERAAAGTR